MRAIEIYANKTQHNGRQWKPNKNRDNLQLQSLCHSLPATIIAIITIAIIIITNLARYR